MKRQYNLLLHPAFLASLFLLLLNDISLKYEFHNALTGKLSDFSGLFAFAIFWLAFFPRYKKTVVFSIAIFFCWWKSSLSTSFIESWNTAMPVSIARVIDHSDLIALIVLPVAVIIARQTFDPRVKYKRIFIPLAGSVALFSFCFTSPPRYAAYYTPPNEIRFYGTFNTRKSEQEILNTLIKSNITFHADSIGYYQLRSAYYDSEDYVLRIGDPHSDTVRWVTLNNSNDSLLFVRRKEGTFYIIPHYSLDGQELTNVKISISENGSKGSRVFVQTFQWNSREEFSNKIKRRYKAHFKDLLR